MTPHPVYEFVAAGAGDEVTLLDNQAAFDRIKLRQRVLRDVFAIDTQVELFGSNRPHPILLASTSLQRLSHPDGEVAAEGAREKPAHSLPCHGGHSDYRGVRRRQRLPGMVPALLAERPRVQPNVVARIEAGGAKALMITVDTPTLGDRVRRERAGFALPDDLVTPYYYDRNAGLRKRGSRLMGRLTWREIEWIRLLPDCR